VYNAYLNISERMSSINKPAVDKSVFQALTSLTTCLAFHSRNTLKKLASLQKKHCFNGSHSFS
jgi:hypothetical protein